MALISRIGRETLDLNQYFLGARMAGRNLGKKGAIGAGLGYAAVTGGMSGFNSTSGDLNDAFYEITTGNPNIDEEVFGTSMSSQELMMPWTATRGVRSPVAGAAFGGILGGGLGALFGGKKAVLSGIVGATIGAGAGGGAAFMTPERRRTARLMMQPQMTASTQSNIRYNRSMANKMPDVRGSMVFGQYTSRGGGGGGSGYGY